MARPSTNQSELGANVAPLLAGAGLFGVALGFGSQKLVQDLITGIFLLLENAMQVGEWVIVAGLSGTVEKLSIRTMKLRAGDGAGCAGRSFRHRRPIVIAT